MNPFSSRFGKSRFFEAALGIVLLHSPLYSEEQDPELGFLSSPPDKGGKQLEHLQQSEDQHNTPTFKNLEKNKDTYTINFSNVSIIEYIRFASKITNLNFVFNEDDLQFNVTVVSEEPVSPRNIMSILIQVLRINGLVVLEQDNNLLITKVRSVTQLATVVAGDLPSPGQKSPIVTRVFRLKNANLNTVASVIKPMLSDSALLEVSSETRQLIITDITTNVDKISTLLATIDAPHTSLEIDSYVVQNVNIDKLIALATQIVTPFSEGNPVTFVPQSDTSTIFIISTPYLIERALTVLEDLDSPTRERTTLAARDQVVFLYPLKNKSGDVVLDSIEALSKQLKSRGASYKLTDTLDSARWVKESNSILFIGDQETIDKIKEFLPTIGTEEGPGSGKNFYVYKIQHASAEQIEESLDALAQDLQKSPQPDQSLIEALTTFTYVKESNSLIFTGNENALQKVAETLPAFDVSTNGSGASPTQFLVYNPKKLSGRELQSSIEELASNLTDSGLKDKPFLQTLESMKWNPSTNSLIFTGNAETLARTKTLLESLDGGESVEGGPASHTFFLYKLKQAQGDVVLDHLGQVADNLKNSKLPNRSLISTLNDVKWIKDNNTLLITGPKTAVEQARTIVEEFDIPSLEQTHLSKKSEFFIYKPLHLGGPAIVESLKDLGKDLEASGLSDTNLLSTINTVRFVESTNSLIFTGTPDSIEKVQSLLSRIDTLTPQEMQIQQLGEMTFLIYKVQYVSAPQLIASLRGVTTDLQKSGAADPQVIEGINGMKWIKETNSLMITGTPSTLQKIEVLLKKFDVPTLANKTAPVGPSNFVVYTPKYQPGDDLIKILEEFEQNLVASGVNNKNLFDTIANLKYVPRTCSLIISGDQESIARVEELLRRFDVPTTEPSKVPPSIESIQNTSFLIYKLQYHQGNEILSAIKQIAADLGAGTATGNQNLLNAVNSLQWIRVTNSLLATGEADTLTKLRDLIQNLDVPLRQVFIEVLVIETTVGNTQNFGLQWGGKMQFLNKFAAGSGNFPGSSTSTPATSNPVQPQTNGFTTGNSIMPGINGTNATTGPSSSNIPLFSGWDLGVIGDIIMHKGKSFISLGSLVNALQSDGDSTIVLNPKIITQDNRTSTIFVGQNIPFIGSQVSTNSNIVSQTSNIEYRDIGFNLTITPTIGNSDIVTLNINTDISQVTSNPLIGSNNSSGTLTGTITGIETNHTSMTTQVHVPDKHFVVLSGMISDTKTRYKSGIPCLGGLPVLGVFFSETDRAATKQNLIFFIRPHIVNTYEEYRMITDRQEEVFKENAVLPVLKEEFDAGVDIVKTPEDE